MSSKHDQPQRGGARESWIGTRDFTRRQTLAGGAALFAGAVLLDETAGSASALVKPKRGGTLRIGIVGQGNIENLDPSQEGNSETIRGEQLWDRLFDLNPDLRTLNPKLALSAESNADATVWTFKLRHGVVWHDGKPFGADDVVYTMKSWGEKSSVTFGALTGVVDYKGIRADGKLTVVVPLVAASAQFPSLIAVSPVFGIQQAGSTLKGNAFHPIGTGPFKRHSFTPGVQSIFVANRNYFEHDGPYLDAVLVNSSFSDPNAMVNALLGGELDGATLLPQTAAAQAGPNSFDLLRGKGGNAYWLYMDVTKAPFNDVRVRQAMKLLPNRQAMIDSALVGYGEVANDLYGVGDEYYDASLVRHQDIDKAKSLLKAAGHADTTFSLATSQAFPGCLSAGTVFSEQAIAAGINVKLDVISTPNYYGAGYPFLFAEDFSQQYASLSAWYRTSFIEYNESRWNTAGDKALQAAFTELNPVLAKEKWAKAQSEQFNEGGVLLWAMADLLDGLAKNVRGIPASRVNCMNNYRFVDAWLA